jgi:class 3 adenylate cyclase
MRSATFDGPAQAFTCAQAIEQAVADLGIQIWSGVHTGEVELDGDNVHGIAVHIAARVAALAGPSEVGSTGQHQVREPTEPGGTQRNS